MKQIISRILIFSMFISCTALLLSCGDKSIPTDVPISEFTDKFSELLVNSDKLSAVDDDYLMGMFNISAADVDDYALMIQAMGTAIDQYGIFKVSDSAKRTDIKAAVQSYIDTTRTNWANFNYLPEETVKINSAEVLERGNYILFAILSETEKNQIIDAFNSILK